MTNTCNQIIKRSLGSDCAHQGFGDWFEESIEQEAAQMAIEEDRQVRKLPVNNGG